MEYGTALSVGWLGDLGALRDATHAFDEAGIDFVTTGGHALTSRDGRYPDRRPELYAGVYRDPFVLYAHLAATTTRIRFRTGILILPMMPTVLVAKQSAELSLMSGGRFELGVGISWNESEYLAFGQPLARRGARLAEQITVLHQLWSEPFVTFKGEFHDIEDLGLGGRPEHPIPIWIGTGAPVPAAIARVGRLADGWMSTAALDRGVVDQIHAAAAAAGRNGAVGVMARVSASPDTEAAVAEAWSQIALGATQLQITAPTNASVQEGVAAVIATRAALVEALGA